MTTINKIEVVKNAFVVAAENEQAVKLQAEEKMTQAQNEDEKREHEKLYMRARTHERYNSALSNMSDKALQALIKLKVSESELAAQSRELKKRSIAILEAVAHAQRVDDRALDAVLQRLAAKRESKLSIAQIQREMQHQTATQASYFKTCALFYNFATYNKTDKEVVFNYDSQVLKQLLSIYA